MSTFKQRFQKIVNKLSDKIYRDAYVEEQIDGGLAFQIRDMRKDRGWTQEEFAEKINTQQTSISRFEDPNYGKHSLKTLKKMASVFDVALMVRFVPFSELARRTCNMNTADINVTAFTDDSSLNFDHQTEGYVTYIDAHIGANNAKEPARLADAKPSKAYTQSPAAVQ